MPSSVLILLADGFEEIEATAPIDLLRRAEAVVTVASCSDSLSITGRSHISLQTDILLSDINDPLGYDMLVIPGGPAVFELRKRSEIIDLIRNFATTGKPIGAICAAPLLCWTPNLSLQGPTAPPTDQPRAKSPKYLKISP